MRLVRLTVTARQDLAEIAEYLIENVGKVTAERVVLRIETQIDKLANNALRYRERPELGSGKRAILVGPYIAIYRITAKCVFVVRILHSARDISKDLVDEH